MSVARLVADPKARSPALGGSRVAGLAPCLPQRMAVRRVASPMADRSRPSLVGQRSRITPITVSTKASSLAAGGEPTEPAEAAAAPAGEAAVVYTKEFLFRRMVVFLGIVLGYSCYYLTRNSLTYTAPVMVADASLGMDITQVGAMTSIFPIAYGMSKFVSGVLGARTSPQYLLAGGLMATAAVNVLFGFGTSLVWFCVFWGINGILQGLGGPCCARILTSWFATKERGTYWGMWNIAHNLGGFAAPILAGTAARQYGWQWGMWAPGICGVFVGIIVLLAVRDTPEKVGFPPVELPPKPDPVPDNADGTPGTALAAEKPGLLALLLENVLKNPYIWAMAFTYFFIYVIRQGVTSWFVFYLVKQKGLDAGQAAVRVSSLELGGLVGSLIAGRISDYLIARSGGKGGNVGKRVQVVMAYTVGIALALGAFWTLPGNVWWLQWITVFMIGFFLYGPQMLIGLCGAELVGPESVGASEGFLGWIAYLGAANAGIPLSIIVKNYGWNAYFTALIAACGMALLLLSPMVNLKSYVQREEKRKAKLA